MKTYFAAAALATALTCAVAPAQADNGASQSTEKRTERLTRRSAAVGQFISRFTTETVSFPGTGEIPCELLVGNPQTPFVTNCGSAQMVDNRPDGTAYRTGAPLGVLMSDSDDDLGEDEMTLASDSLGTWRANTRSTVQAKFVNVTYHPDATIEAFRVTETRGEVKPDKSGVIGTFDSRVYGPDQDPLDVNEPFLVRSLGTFETQRVE